MQGFIVLIIFTAGCLAVDPVNTPVIRQDPDLGLIWVDQSIQFSVDPDDLPTVPIWTFGDGRTARGLEVAHVYEAAGRYLVSMSAGEVASTTVAAVSIQVLVDLEAPRSNDLSTGSAALLPVVVEQNATALVFNLSFSDPLPMHRVVVELRAPSGEAIHEFSPWGERYRGTEDYTLEEGIYKLAFWTDGPVEEIRVQGWVAVNYWPREDTLKP